MPERRVVVTGLGTVNALGASVPEFWNNSIAGLSGIRAIDEFDIPETMSRVAGVADCWQGGPTLRESLDDWAGEDRNVHLARAAAKEAVLDAAIDPDELGELWGDRAAVYIATAISHITRMEARFKAWTDGGRRPYARSGTKRPRTNEFSFVSASASVAEWLGVPAQYGTIATGCTGGVDAIGWAYRAIKYNGLDLIVTGSCEAPITPLVVGSFSQINATSRRNYDPAGSSRPFDESRDGFVLAEGAGVLVLEELQSALNRGVQIYGEIGGYGSVNSAYHMTSIPEDGNPIVRASRIAMDDAGIHPDAVDFINAHGSGTPLNDVAESNAFHALFGDRAREIPVTSNKSQTGHSLAAANSIEVISSFMAMRNSILSPTINLNRQDPRCDLDVVANVSRSAEINCVLKSSSGFSGIHSSIVLRSYESEGH
ncbi:beta-ketoacyl-[acyl-carrier-protein] synthase family protein [Paenarthrobacter sp. NPDC089675]|uniref:beta-ketoacyl-[acyl-carrier-protein] synthase family protein n=1 Tax=Paenarthrobacter sp. NPDC089675 TaxID=3364376 RepID=UPI0037FFEE05